jgi:hypothetical protein
MLHNPQNIIKATNDCTDVTGMTGQIFASAISAFTPSMGLMQEVGRKLLPGNCAKSH